MDKCAARCFGLHTLENPAAAHANVAGILDRAVTRRDEVIVGVGLI
jgi:hypothetical protein